MKSIFIVDDHQIMRDGIKQLIAQEDDLTVIGEAGSATEALEKLGEVHPDLLILDISLKNSSGLDLLQDVKAVYPDLVVLIMSMHEETVFAERALKAGARGYIMKQQSGDELIQAIRKVLLGKVYVSEDARDRILERIASFGRDDAYDSETLSNREIEVFQLIGKGFGSSEIAEQLHIGTKTVETYKERIKAKLNIKSSRELHREAIEWVHGKGS